MIGAGPQNQQKVSNTAGWLHILGRQRRCIPGQGKGESRMLGGSSLGGLVPVVSSSMRFYSLFQAEKSNMEHLQSSLARVLTQTQVAPLCVLYSYLRKGTCLLGIMQKMERLEKKGGCTRFEVPSWEGRS